MKEINEKWRFSNTIYVILKTIIAISRTVFRLDDDFFSKEMYIVDLYATDAHQCFSASSFK